MNQTDWNYEDIVNMPHHVSPIRTQMDISNRAAQFSPFAALSGYDDAVGETARITQDRADLSDEAVADINESLLILMEHASEHPEVTICYFKPDEKKSGGAFMTVDGRLKKLDAYSHEIFLEDGTSIPFENILHIEAAGLLP